MRCYYEPFNSYSAQIPFVFIPIIHLTTSTTTITTATTTTVANS